MPKRDKEDKLWKKLKKLEKKLEKCRRRRLRSMSSTPEQGSSQEREEDERMDILDSQSDKIIEEKDTETQDLDENILSALGNTANLEKIYADELHPELIKRVDNILISGIDKNIRDELFKKYNIPKNLLLLDAPKLNIELEGLLSDPIKERDKRVEERQQQLGIALSAVLTVVHKLIKSNQDAKNIEVLTDVSRLLSDLHYADTVTRRKLISINLDKTIVKAIDSTKRDSFLFSEKFNDNVKSANAIKKAAPSILKKPSSSNKPLQTKQYYKNKENFQAPPRTSRVKQGRGGKYQQRTTGRQHQPRTSSAKTYRHKSVRQT